MKYTMNLLLPRRYEKILVRFPLAYHANGTPAFLGPYERPHIVGEHDVPEGHLYVLRVTKMVVPPMLPPQ